MAIALDTSATGQNSGTGTTLTIPMTLAAGSNRYLVVVTAVRNTLSETVTGVTWGGIALTNIRDLNNNQVIRVTMWGLLAPASGADNVVVTVSSAPVKYAAVCSSWTGVDQTTPYNGYPGTATSAGSKFGQAGSSYFVAKPTSAVGEVVIDGCATANNTTHTPGYNIVGATNASPIQITTTSANGNMFITGNTVIVSGVGGNTAANVTGTVTFVSADVFTEDGTTGNGAYTANTGIARLNTLIASTVTTGGSGSSNTRLSSGQSPGFSTVAPGYTFAAAASFANIAVPFRPAAAGTAYSKALTRTGTVSEAVARREILGRGLTRTGTVTEAAARFQLLGRQATRSGTVSETVARVKMLQRPLLRTGAVSEVVARKQVLARTLTRTGTISELLVRTTFHGGTLFTRSLTRTGIVSEAVVRKLVLGRALLRTGSVAEVLTRRQILGRTKTRTGTVSESVKRFQTLGRHLTRTGTIGDAVGFVRTPAGGGLTYADWGPIVNASIQAITQQYDASTVSGRSIYFEAIIWTTSGTGNTAHCKLLVNSLLSGAGTWSDIGGSDITVTATTPTFVRSGTLSLPQANSLYKVQFGGTTGATHFVFKAGLVVR